MNIVVIFQTVGLVMSLTDEADVGHQAAVVVVVRAAGRRVRRHLTVHVEVGQSRPATQKLSVSIKPQRRSTSS